MRGCGAPAPPGATSRSSKNSVPANSGPIANEKTRLQADEGDRAIRAHRLAERHAGVAVQAGRNIDGEYGATGAVDAADDTPDLLAHAVR